MKKDNNRYEYITYIGGSPVSFKTRKERNRHYNKLEKTKKYLSNGNQNRDNFKSYIWKRVLKYTLYKDSFFFGLIKDEGERMEILE